MRTSRAGSVTRREVVGLILSAAASAVTGACAPVRLDLFRTASPFAEDDELVEATLRAFLETVAPGVRLPASLTRVFADDFFPFGRHRGRFAADLCRRSARTCGVPRFDELDLSRRTAIVHQGLHSDLVSRRLYEGAILLAQLAVFGGIYDENAAVPPLHFEGRYHVYPGDAAGYPHPERFLARPLSADGNPA